MKNKLLKATMVVFSIGVAVFVAIIVPNVLTSRCWECSKYKRELDSAFTKMEFVGVMTDLKYVNRLAHNTEATQINMVNLPHSFHTETDIHFQEIDIRNPREMKLEIIGDVTTRIGVGDTVVKKRGDYYYTIHCRNGDRIFSELGSGPHSKPQSSDWRFLREGNLHCAP